MDGLLSKLQEMSLKIDPALEQSCKTFGEFYKTAGVISETAASNLANCNDFADFSKKVKAFEDSAYKLPAPIRNHGKALAALASIFTYGGVPAGEQRAEYVQGAKESCEMFAQKVLIDCPAAEKPKQKDWVTSLLAIPAHILKQVEGQSPSESTVGGSSIFSAINKGDGVTQGLRKVEDNEKTHKNPQLRATSTVSGTGPSKTSTSSKTDSSQSWKQQNKQPVYEDKNDFVQIKYHDGGKVNITGGPKTKVFISSCANSVFTVDKKITSISIENCENSSFSIDEGVISCVSVIRSSYCNVLCKKLINLISFDNSFNCTISAKESDLLCKERSDKGCSTLQVITSNSSAINVCHLEDDLTHKTEIAVPSIFCSKYDQATKSWKIEPQQV